MRVTLTSLATVLIMSATAMSAGVPNTINYQGRLTDAAGDPVADDAYLVKFIIYDAASGGTVLWNSLFQTINTVDGLFSYDLGSNVVLPELFGTDSIRYLGITVSTDPEINPRTRFTSTGYVFRSLKSDLALDADSLGGLQPAFYLDWVNLTSVPAGFADGSDDAGGPAGGGLSGTYPDPTIAADAVSAAEITDEPGIAANTLSNQVFLDTLAMTDIVTVTITTPTAGYVKIDAKCRALYSGTTARNFGWFQIDETAGGSWTFPYFVGGGADAFVTTGQSDRSIYATRVYFKSAGTYTFRLEGIIYNLSDPGAVVRADNNIIIATFFPSSYGSVTTVASNPGNHPDAKVVTFTGPDGSTQTGYEMDLRYYEEKARASKLAQQKAELAAAEAELELIKAKAQAEEK